MTISVDIVMALYRKVLNFLKAEFPADFPVSIRRLKLSNRLDGDCLLMEDHYRIRINRALSENEAIDTLIHEYSHVLAWNRCNTDYHCNEWGKAYSRIYRKFLKVFVNI